MIPSLVRSGGTIWKFTPRITSTQRAKLRKRSLQVDENIEQIYQGLIQSQPDKNDGDKTDSAKINYLKFEFPKYNDLGKKDRFFTFNRNSKDYRKPVQRVPKWTKLSFRENPKYF
ncbi:hypothetical protein KGF56_001377 [Candida oxycetoniae]|uniref:54S ribosomal protein L31, mitochondrial n=1 Tax=Candida oxycetoniae TaxID=497107 RepID=A0AAI9WZC7_9ASCO|nr:uncharacterized protein KGF56_001377 [Candida oxycetoniae]KAI3405770.2 hypothetical protein KGF56_001377 [Candida oxycetoniae]